MNNVPPTHRHWAPIDGIWRPIDGGIQYMGPSREDSQFPYGLALSRSRLRSGNIRVSVTFDQELQDTAGRILFGFNPETQRYLSAGIGGYQHQYVISEFLPNRGWVGRALAGTSENIEVGLPYSIEFLIQGQRVALSSDEIKVLEHTVAAPLTGDQVGLYAWGREKISFRGFNVEKEKPRAFVVMQFGDPFDALYTDVIGPVVNELEMVAYRADDVYGPGIILKDIISGIVESEVIIAEITPPNANVFYELGYAHALDKPTILLAQRGKPLPFDIRSYRCIFYDNTIQGKNAVETNLRKHLLSILNE